SRVLNISGRQRMLSQKLTKLVLLKGQDYDQARQGLSEYDSLLHTWQVSHQQLKQGILDANERYLVKKSKAIDEKFSEIEPVFEELSDVFTASGSRELTGEAQKGYLDRI